MSHSVAQIGEIGYVGEPAFNRAFKRELGSPPARFRLKSEVAATHEWDSLDSNERAQAAKSDEETRWDGARSP